MFSLSKLLLEFENALDQKLPLALSDGVGQRVPLLLVEGESSGAVAAAVARRPRGAGQQPAQQAVTLRLQRARLFEARCRLKSIGDGCDRFALSLFRLLPNPLLLAGGVLQQVLRFCKPDVIDAAMQQLYDWSGKSATGRPSHRLMTWEELKGLGEAEYATIGCHTHRHPAVGMLSYEEQYAEISRSKEILENLLHTPQVHFSYPFGGRKFLGSKRYYNTDSIKASEALGLEMVCANYHGQVHSWSNHYALPRILVRNWAPEVFRSKMQQFFKY